MDEPEQASLPLVVAQAFQQAVAMYEFWTPRHPDEQALSVNHQCYSIAAVCGLLDKFSDPLPDNVLRALLSYIDESHGDLRVKLAATPTYATGAQCLLKLMQNRTARYAEKERRLRGY